MREDANVMQKAGKEIGKNIPEAMKGLDTEDVGDVDKDPEVQAEVDRR